jgi:hypothetical protein
MGIGRVYALLEFNEMHLNALNVLTFLYVNNNITYENEQIVF